MTKIIIVTHGPLAGSMKESAKMFFGDMAEEIIAIEYQPDKSLDSLKKEIVMNIEETSQYLIFVDIFAGTPFNVVALMMEEQDDASDIECFTGVNMPLLMETMASKNSMTFPELVSHIETAANGTIVNLKKALEL